MAQGKKEDGEVLKDFKSKLKTLPSRILGEMDTLILRGDPATKIHAWLVDQMRGRGSAGWGPKATANYVVARKKQLNETMDAQTRAAKQFALTEDELIQLEGKINTYNLNPGDRKANLEHALQILFYRVGVLRQMQTSEMNPQYERLIGSHINSITGITAQLEKMDSGGGLNENMIGKFLELFFKEFAPKVKESFVKVVPGTDSAEFLRVLNKAQQNIDINRIRDEAVAYANDKDQDIKMAPVKLLPS